MIIRSALQTRCYEKAKISFDSLDSNLSSHNPNINSIWGIFEPLTNTTQNFSIDPCSSNLNGVRTHSILNKGLSV
ncbi:hypothetical protein MTsPCn5_15280 [Croceitalea sp. MTPC5]|uniref:hypothetical protein n=1 Tax=Croceitalea sp. MTPC5 TaxID=3056565 RepID=UPI002B3DA32A|nr:hypothetical protein MTsPCn5_15280 [Croceitalea sp. MTPC5]